MLSGRLAAAQAVGRDQVPDQDGLVNLGTAVAFAAVPLAVVDALFYFRIFGGDLLDCCCSHFWGSLPEVGLLSAAGAGAGGGSLTGRVRVNTVFRSVGALPLLLPAVGLGPGSSRIREPP